VHLDLLDVEELRSTLGLEIGGGHDHIVRVDVEAEPDQGLGARLQRGGIRPEDDRAVREHGSEKGKQDRRDETGPEHRCFLDRIEPVARSGPPGARGRRPDSRYRGRAAPLSTKKKLSGRQEKPRARLPGGMSEAERVPPSTRLEPGT
jgi:hypothetical protein